MIVIACGGGGAPVYDDPTPGLGRASTAVVDKDLAAAVLARDLGAELLLILTDVDAVYADWGTPQQRPLARLTVDEAATMDRAGGIRRGQHGAEDSRGSRLRAPHRRSRDHHRACARQRSSAGRAGTEIDHQIA